MLTVLFVLIAAAFITTIAVAMNHCPQWVPVLLLCIIALIQVLPLK